MDAPTDITNKFWEDPGSLKGIDWNRIHFLATKHSNSVPAVLDEFLALMDEVIDGMSANKGSEKEISELKDAAKLIAASYHYVQVHGEKAFRQAEDYNIQYNIGNFYL